MPVTRFPGGAGDAEVDQVGEVVLSDQDVGGLDVAVHQPDPVRGVQRRGDLLDDPDGAAGARSIGDDSLQVATFDQPHVHVQAAVDLTEVVDRHDVRLVESRGGVGLAAESLVERRIVRQVCR